MTNNRVQLFVIALIFLCGISRGAEITDAVISVDGSANFMLKDGPTIIKVEVRTVEMMVASNAIPPDVSSIMPVASKIIVNVNGRDIFVPRSVYADLIDIKNGHLKNGDKWWVFCVTGGDGSETYTVNIYFDRKQVRRRIKFSGLNEDIPIELTVYPPLQVIP